MGKEVSQVDAPFPILIFIFLTTTTVRKRVCYCIKGKRTKRERTGGRLEEKVQKWTRGKGGMKEKRRKEFGQLKK